MLFLDKEELIICWRILQHYFSTIWLISPQTN